MTNPYRSFVRWLARRDIEAAWRERADAVNDAINWRVWHGDVLIVSRARAEALDAIINANVLTPAQISLTIVQLEGSSLPAEVKALAVQELRLHVPVIRQEDDDGAWTGTSGAGGKAVGDGESRPDHRRA